MHVGTSETHMPVEKIYVTIYIYTLYLIRVILPKLPFEWENDDQPPGFFLGGLYFQTKKTGGFCNFTQENHGFHQAGCQ